MIVMMESLLRVVKVEISVARVIFFFQINLRNQKSLSQYLG